MINLKEVRVGNYVRYGGKIQRIHKNDSHLISFGTDKSNTTYPDTNEKNIFPIQITEGVLTELCGFKKAKKNYFMLNLSNDVPCFLCYGLLLRPVPCAMILHTPEGEEINIPIPNDIQYLHQLQNLWRELTGHDLEIRILETA